MVKVTTEVLKVVHVKNTVGVSLVKLALIVLPVVGFIAFHKYRSK